MGTPLKFGLIFRGIAKIGADAAGEKLAIEHEHIVARGGRAGLRPSDDAASNGRAIDGADEHEAPGRRQLAEEIERSRAPEQDAAIGDVVDPAIMRGLGFQRLKIDQRGNALVVTGTRSVAVRRR